MKTLLKAAGAVVAAIIVTVGLSYGTDYILQSLGLMESQGLPLDGSEALIIGVILYRTVYVAAGSYVLARLAPKHPMRFVLTFAVLGTLGSIGAALNPESQSLAPAWYNWSLALLGLPAAWLGGKLYESNIQRRQIHESGTPVSQS